MNLEEAKENIQPLASGRNIRRLENALNAESHEELQAELLQERHQYEESIRSYTGTDPLGPWYHYILWVEQSYPKSGKQSALDEVIQKCLLTFDSDDRYRQDPRMIKLYIKYIDAQPNPTEHFQTLYNSGIGTMVADLYICWAYFYDIADNFEKAESVFRKGKDARAEPIDQLEHAHKQFGFSMSQRLLHKEDYREDFMNTMEERRFALTSLQAQHDHKHVGSIRTGVAVKSQDPGLVNQHRLRSGNQANRSNTQVSIFVDKSQDVQHRPVLNSTHATQSSVIQSIMDSSRKQENLREPGPWSKAGASKLNTLYSLSGSNSVPFPILEDMDMGEEMEPIPMTAAQNNYIKGIRLPNKFASRNAPITDFPTPYFIEEPLSATTYPAYDKCLLFPKPDKSFSIEELAGYRWYKRMSIKNYFTIEQDLVWANEPSVGIRLYPQWCDKNDTDEIEWKTDRFIEEDTIRPGKCEFAFDIASIYPTNSHDEQTTESRLYEKWQRGELVSQQMSSLANESALDDTDYVCSDMMDETIPIKGRQSIFHGAIRKSVAHGGRKSIIPISEDARKSVLSRMSLIENTSKEPNMAFSVISEVAIEDSLRKAPFTLEAKKCLFESLTTSDTKKENTTTPIIDPYKPTPFPFEPNPTNLLTVSQESDLDKSKTKLHKTVLFKTAEDLPVIHALTTPKLTGILRKSICPSKRKIENACVPEVLPKELCLNETSSGSCLAITQREIVSPSPVAPINVMQSKEFAIFEDPIEELNSQENKFAPKNDEDGLFKTPLLPMSLTARSAPSIVVEPEEEPDYHPNETCSTQQFMFFIKAQSVSTPKSNQRPNVRSDVSCSGSIDYSKTSPVPMSSAEPFAMAAEVYTQQPRHLSTIMETTEINTAINSISSDRDSDSTSKTISRQAGISGKSVLVNNQTISSTVASNSIIAPTTLSPIKIYKDLENESIFQNETNEINRKVLGIPQQETAVINSSIIPISHQSSVFPTLPDLNEMNHSNELSIPIYRDLTQQMPVIPCSALRSNESKMKVLTDRPAASCKIVPKLVDVSCGMPLDHPLSQMPNITLPAFEILDERTETNIAVNPFEPSMRLERTVMQSIAPPEQDVSIPSISAINFFQDATTSQLPVISCAKISSIIETGDQVIDALAPHIKETSNKPKSETVNTRCVQEDIEPCLPASCETDILHSRRYDEDDFFEMFSKTPEKSKSISTTETTNSTNKHSRIPVPFSTKQPLLQPSIQELSTKQSSTSSLIYATAPPFASIMISNQLNMDRTSIQIKDELSETGTPDPLLTPSLEQTTNSTAKMMETNLLNISALEIDDISDKDDTEKSENGVSVKSFDVNSSKFSHKPFPEFKPQSYGSWHELSGEPDNATKSSSYVPPTIDLNDTRQVIESHLVDAWSNPFDDNIKIAFLEQCDFFDYMRNLDTCVMVNKLQPVHPKSLLEVGDRVFHVHSLIGQGKYGHVFSAKCQHSGNMYALKQQRPANLWEYYICLEIESRIDVPNMVPAFIPIECALIGNNASILVSPFSKYGTLIDVCNKVRKVTGKNIAEPVVKMLAMQMLSIVDHLHAARIIHADIKPDNILLIRRLSYDHHEMCLQLIDFGQAIDLKLYPEGQTFRSKLLTENFVCTEMLDDRPWTHQTDLYSLAATIHTLLFGADMLVRKSPLGYKLSTAFPRYISKCLWESIFNTLINIKDCRTMPNLQALRTTLLQEVSNEKEYSTQQAIVKFNNILDQK